MYKPVPSNEGDESETEPFSSSFNPDEKSLSQHSDGQEDGNELGQSTELPPMSCARKAVLGFSIASCVACTIMFLWVLPCDYDTCYARPYIKDREWEVSFNNQGVHQMTLAAAQMRKSREVLVIATGKLANATAEPLCMKNQSDSLTAFRAADGESLWSINLTSNIQQLNCSLIDVNGDGIYDCLVFSSTGVMSVIDSFSGILLWKQNMQDGLGVSNSSRITLVNVDAVVDINNDGAFDILAVMSNTTTWYFVGVSGKTGAIVWQLSVNSSCAQQSLALLVEEFNRNSSVCIEPTGLTLLNSTNLALSDHTSTSLNITSCATCISHISGIPNTQYLLHRGMRNYLVTAAVNCSTMQTVLKKSFV